MEKVKARLFKNTVSTNDSNAFTLQKKSSFGEKSGEKIVYSLSEAMYLVEKDKIEVLQKDNPLERAELFRKLQNADKRFSIKYPVFRYLRDQGYVVKTALKFGADFRVYGKGKPPGKAHSKWIVFCQHETENLSWQNFSAKNRVAHSTNKNLLLAIVDEENDVTFYEVSWIQP
ncbi:MAG: tRNA-intron lyase [Candidatus Pacearchaeota archaeon]